MKLHDSVTLTTDEYDWIGLRKGSIGTIVQVYDEGRGFEVEFEGFGEPVSVLNASILAFNGETGTQNETSAKTHDDRLHNDCDGGQCVACHEDQKNA
jgi:hypothetical protein